MKEIKFIKEFYRPIQPTVRSGDSEVLYLEVSPDKKLENYVYCYWQLKTLKPLKNRFIYKVVSDGCIDIFFKQEQPSENYIMGFCKKYTEFALENVFNYIGIRFLPSAFPLIFKIDAKRLSNQAQELSEVLPELSKWITTINPEMTFQRIVEIVNAKLKKEIQYKNFDLDSRFFNSLRLVFQRRGFLDTESELITGLSPRQLRRKFNFYIGTTPKSFCHVVRFQYILNSTPSRQSLKESKLFFDVGFFDQAHFIKNFKNFYGITPFEAFR